MSYHFFKYRIAGTFPENPVASKSFLERAAKRSFDLFFTISGIIFLIPVFLIIALLIKLDSPGKVFFTQIRVGQYGRKFLICKFRTMAGEIANLEEKHLVEGYGRVTRLGKFLRKYKLDELPQLYNVLKGEMSLVGPRPMVPKLVEQYPPKVRELVLSVLPGITDFASIFYINEEEILKSVQDPDVKYREEILPTKLSYYSYYVKEQSVWLDMQIICLTILHLLSIPFCSLFKIKPPFIRIEQNK